MIEGRSPEEKANFGHVLAFTFPGITTRRSKIPVIECRGMRTPLVYLALFLSLLYTATAQIAPVADCTPGITPFVPTFSLSSTVGVVADYTLFCTNTGFSSSPISSLNFAYTLNTTDLNTGAWTLTEGLNTYSGTLFLSNQIRFLGVAYDPNQPTLNFEIHGVEVNPSLLPGGFQYQEVVALNGSFVPTVLGDPVELVAMNEITPEPITLSLAALALVALSIRAKLRPISMVNR